MQLALTFNDVSLVPTYTGSPSRKEVDTTVHLGPYTFKTPLISANMDSVTSARMARRMFELGGLGILHRFCAVKDNVVMYKEAAHDNYLIGVSIGVNEKELERLNALVEAGARIICVDTAHAHSKLAGTMIKAVKALSKELFVIAGNICTEAGADYLSSCGADCVKAGVGSGAACITRLKTGVGVPQLTAVMESSRVKVPVISDGGVKKGADFVKALVAGAEMAMCGALFASTDESPMPEQWGRKIYRGSASREAQEDFMGTMSDWKTSEGISFQVECTGPVENTVQDLMGGLRSAMTYCGATNITDLRRRAKFVRVTHNGYTEGTAHGQTR